MPIEVDFTDEEMAHAAARCKALAGVLREMMVGRFSDWKSYELVAALGAITTELLLSGDFTDEERAEWVAVMTASLFGGQVYNRKPH
jgi:hypothetical protein